MTGWKTVPIEPTTVQLRAGQDAWLKDPLRLSSTLYRAMVVASPATPGAEVEPVAKEGPDAWLIRKGSYYYRPNCQGYTVNKHEAGRYSEAKAKSEASVEPWHMSAVLADDVPGSPMPWLSFQRRVHPWMMACFGPEISADKLERGDRLLEEVLELLQSVDYPRERIDSLSSYVWSRPKGEPVQEVGGVEVTLAAFCLAHDLDKHAAGEAELARIWTKVDAIRAKQAAKPTGSALPIAITPTPVTACAWPEGKTFGFHDDPGEHEPCYVIMPDGGMLVFNHHAGEGVDIARALFVQSACNAALAPAKAGGDTP